MADDLFDDDLLVPDNWLEQDRKRTNTHFINRQNDDSSLVKKLKVDSDIEFNEDFQNKGINAAENDTESIGDELLNFPKDCESVATSDSAFSARLSPYSLPSLDDDRDIAGGTKQTAPTNSQSYSLDETVDNNESNVMRTQDNENNNKVKDTVDTLPYDSDSRSSYSLPPLDYDSDFDGHTKKATPTNSQSKSKESQESIEETVEMSQKSENSNDINMKFQDNVNNKDTIDTLPYDNSPSPDSLPPLDYDSDLDGDTRPQTTPNSNINESTEVKVDSNESGKNNENLRINVIAEESVEGVSANNASVKIISVEPGNLEVNEGASTSNIIDLTQDNAAESKTDTKIKKPDLIKVASVMRDAKIISGLVTTQKLNDIYELLLENRERTDRLDHVTAILLDGTWKEATVENNKGKETLDIFDEVAIIMKRAPQADANEVYTLLESMPPSNVRIENVITKLKSDPRISIIVPIESIQTEESSLKKEPSNQSISNDDPLLKSDPLFCDMTTIAKIFPEKDRNEIYALLEANFNNSNRLQTVIDEIMALHGFKTEPDQVEVISEEDMEGESYTPIFFLFLHFIKVKDVRSSYKTLIAYNMELNILVFFSPV